MWVAGGILSEFYSQFLSCLCLKQEKNPFYELINLLKFKFKIGKYALVHKLQHSNLGKWLSPRKDIHVFMFDLE